jgi:DNA-binding response OmpR family regulator
VLIVEPEPLLQWSLGTYLSQWFDVYVADGASAAQALLDEHAVTAVIVSAELPDGAAARVEAWARVHNRDVTVVRTVTCLPVPSAGEEGAYVVEKPFELAAVASLLGAPAVSG